MQNFNLTPCKLALENEAKNHVFYNFTPKFNVCQRRSFLFEYSCLHLCQASALSARNAASDALELVWYTGVTNAAYRYTVNELPSLQRRPIAHARNVNVGTGIGYSRAPKGPRIFHCRGRQPRVSDFANPLLCRLLSIAFMNDLQY